MMCENIAHEVAAMLGEDGATVPLNRPGRVVVYRRTKGAWQRDREMEFEVDPGKGLGELRSRTRDLLGLLNECRIFVARSASGVLYYELEKGQFTVWEIPGRPEEFLELVWSEDEAEREAVRRPTEVIVPTPLESSPGNFIISIRDIQGKRPELSSKQVLQQFIRNGKFKTLEIACDHVPPWIGLEAERVGFIIETERPGRSEVIVRLIMTGRGTVLGTSGQTNDGPGCGC